MYPLGTRFFLGNMCMATLHKGDNEDDDDDDDDDNDNNNNNNNNNLTLVNSMNTMIGDIH